MKSERIPQINFLRGLAILMVVYQHVFASFISHKLGTNLFIDDGWIGVNLFFILSGFVLFKPYVEGKRSFENKESFKKFYGSRFSRLYPLLAFNVFIAIAFFYGSNPRYLESGFLTLTTLSMFTVSNFLPIINGLLWSLVIEIWFSVIFPFVVKLINKFGFKKVLITVFISALVLRFLGTFMSFEYLNINPIKDFFLARLDDFVLGMFIVFAFVKYKSKFENLKKYNLSFLLLSIFSLFAGMLIYELVDRARIPNYTLAFMNNFYQLGFGLLTVVALNATGILKKIFMLTPVRIVGVMCYSIYIWHVSLIPLLLQQVTIPNLIIYFVFLGVISFITFRYIEYRKYDFKDIKEVV